MASPLAWRLGRRSGTLSFGAPFTDRNVDLPVGEICRVVSAGAILVPPYAENESWRFKVAGFFYCRSVDCQANRSMVVRCYSENVRRRIVCRLIQ